MGDVGGYRARSAVHMTYMNVGAFQWDGMTCWGLDDFLTTTKKNPSHVPIHVMKAPPGWD